MDENAPQSWLHRNGLFAAGISIALTWLIAAVALMQLVDPDDSWLESGNYQSYHQYVDAAGFAAVSGLILAVMILLAWILKLLQERRRLEDAPGGRRTLKVLLVVGLFLMASGLMGIRIVIASVDRSPEIMETERLHNHIYYLTHRPTSDRDSNEIILYECTRPYKGCHSLHTEYSTDIDRFDLVVVPETGTIQLMKDGHVAFTYNGN